MIKNKIMKKLFLIIGLKFILFSNILSSNKWIAVPMVSQAILDTGHTGGEGCQVIQALDIDSTGQFLVFVTDVGGVWKTNDGGDNWYPSNAGYKARGGSAVAIDPNNSNIVLIEGSNSTDYGGWHGLYLSEDKGESWSHVLPMTYEGYRDFREAIAFDKSSLSGGRSQVVYWSAPDSSEGGPGGFYKSTDGGRTWTKVNNSYGQGFVKVHPTNGIVYVANASGFHRSIDGGVNFTTTSSGPVRGLDVVSSQPDNVYILKQDGVYVSTDSGISFTRRSNTNLDTGCNSNGGPWLLRVSPVNPNRMVIDINCGEMFTARHQYSSNGGNSWATSNIADTWLALAPYNNRIRAYAWHPTNEYVVYSFGGDWMSKSTDGGATFRYESDGYNAIMPGAIMNFNVFNPDILLVTSQDYNSYLTLDGGRTWKYLEVSGYGWGGFNYGGYPIDATHLVVADAASWGGTRYLKVSHDGGNTWTSTGLAGNSYQAACGDPADPNIAFCHQYRTTDKGYNWSAMNNCVAVYTYNPAGNKELYGCNGNGLVRSYDHGASWQTLVTLSEGIIDVAYDYVKNRAYIATSGKRLYQYDISSSSLVEITSRIPLDNNNSRRVSTVCVDPVDPSIVYAGDHGDVYATNNAVVYSIDAGVTWNRLTKQIGETGPDGGREAVSVRVHPITRDLWVGGQCYGVWRHPCVKLSNNTPTNTPFAGSPTFTPTITQTPSFTSTFTSTQTFTSTPTPKIADAVNASITIDGQLNDTGWNYSNWNQISKIVYGTNINNVTARFKSAWDNNYFYVGIEVLDNNLYNDSQPNGWDDDAVEIYLDMNRNRSTTYLSDDFQYIFGYGYSSIFEKNGRTTGVLFNTGIISGGYSIEIGIPWSVLGKTPGIEEIYGFDVGINIDEDGGAREGQLMWNGTANNWTDTSSFGDMRLQGAIATSTYTYTRTMTTTMTYTPTGTPTNTRTFTFTLTETQTNTRTVTMTGTNTNTLTSTHTATSTGTNTNSPTHTYTFSATATLSASVSPSYTQTDTQTNTATATNSQTATFSYTVTMVSSQTPTDSYTGTETATESVTATETETTIIPSLTFTATRTQTETPTLTNSETYTMTFTFTYTATVTPSFTTTQTPTFTYTLTNMPTYTQTFTSTATNFLTFTLTATSTQQPIFTPTSTQTIDNLESTIGNVFIYPNPYNPEKGDLQIRFDIKRASKLIKVKIYTVSLRKIKEIEKEGQYDAGQREIYIEGRHLNKLSNGTYVILLIIKNMEWIEVKSKPEILIIMK